MSTTTVSFTTCPRTWLFVAGLAALFSTHPPICERIRLLHGYHVFAPEAA
jgi:Zn-dependent protease with chaperone function